MKSKINLKFNLVVFFLALAFVGCKEEKKFDDFKFPDKDISIDCEKENLKLLINEAIYSFEDDITKFYSKDQPNINLAYSQFVRNAINGRVKYTDIVSPHTVKVFEALKKEGKLWDAQNTKSHLNYNSAFFQCLADNIQDKNLKTTLNALISTNSMSPKLFGSPLMTRYNRATSDKYLAGYIAFDLYYAKLFDVDLTQVKEKPIEDNKVDFNKVPTQ
tara:strand:+ start:1365 stop:2015 length:651 start_codon:yes stop_codon:yes gene_type:complete